MVRPSPTAGITFFDGETLARMIATAVVTLSRQHVPRNPVYDDAVQSAFNHLVLLCLRRSVTPPSSIPDMARWAAHKPLRDWPLGLPEELTTSDGYLVDADTHAPTQQCLEWVVSAPNPAAEQFENQLMIDAIGECRVAKSPESYTAFRRLLITRPVLTGAERGLLGEDLDLSLLIETIKRSYEPASAAYLRDGVYAECARCHCLLVPLEHGGYRCELDRCRRDAHPTVGRTLDPVRSGGVYQLTRPLRMFITGPGLAEVDLETALAAKQLTAEMWPNFDAYDLRITLSNRQVWAIDVKDRANPAFLGRGTQPFRTDPPFDRAFLVVPQYRFVEREAYARIFTHHLPEALRGRVQLLSDQDFLRRLTTEQRKIRRAGTNPATSEGQTHA